MHRTTLNRQSSITKSIIEYPWTKTKEEVAELLNVEEEIGLSEERVNRDLQKYGPNG